MGYLNTTIALAPDQPTRAPGLLLCMMLAAGAMVVASATGIPAVLAALALGIAARPVADEIAQPSGINWCARSALRIGIALIGARLSLADLESFGWPAAALAVTAVVLSLSLGTAVGLIFGLPTQRATLSAGAVGICGASAALAISAVLPPTPERERQTVYTICVVTLLSTAAMLLYPLIGEVGGLSDVQAGMFFGGSIHDLAQVIGAGAMVSPEATEAATVTKLIRVACLAPAVMVLGLYYSSRASVADADRPPLLPNFLLAFIGLAVAANLGLLPRSAVEAMIDASVFCLVIATVALGLKTYPRALIADGWRPALAAIAQTLILAAVIFAGVLMLD